jgi:UDP-4-amino-4,6-dideoxy-N-acetyl-beta-L-altrosamine N-acetyltransferase
VGENTSTGGLRPMLHADLAHVLDWRNHPDVRRFMYTQQLIGMAEHQQWFDRTLQDPRKYLFIYENDGVTLGFVQFGVLGAGAVADWGFYAKPDAPRGSGRQMGRAALHHAFGALGLHKVCGQALSFNERSIRFHTLLGFRQEATLREQHFDGERYHDVICFGLLSSEWQQNL